MSDTADDFRTAARSAAELVSDYLDAVPGGPVWQPMDEADRQALLDLPLPADGMPLAGLLEVIGSQLMTAPMGNGHPRFFGWVNSAPAPAGVLATLAAAAMNPSSAGGDHADVHLERAVVRWIAELVGFPHPAGGGILTSGTSMATILCLAAARNRAARLAGHDLREDGLAGLPPLVAYATAETHSCVRKAVELLGLGSRHLRTVATDAEGRLDPAALAAAVAADRAAGLLPFLAVASAGTVGTGVVDAFDPIADVCAAEGLWLHVDGAYGAFGVLDPGLADRYAGMDRADSLALDPHKWLGVPVDCGCALVRDTDELRGTFSLVPSYLRDEAAGALGWFSEYGMEQTRPFRSRRRRADRPEGRHHRTLVGRDPGAPELDRTGPAPGRAGRGRPGAGAARPGAHLDRGLPVPARRPRAHRRREPRTAGRRPAARAGLCYGRALPGARDASGVSAERHHHRSRPGTAVVRSPQRRTGTDGASDRFMI
ncbi:pyridoxal-dependent decarboxylase [Kitasatospora sp. Root107]|uniref:pyridoxal phosphate-dependent decarboxylase family protein n=1 Tax=Kitasatospora sp. Root107 TaxID=1736424 RepID=UPI00070D6E4F|nr:pyridoxal-dependent decarboxylase [Kitasatospora sp. Root107]KQV14305.1 amino acid decarboxylase [Kitasatospora sp. Root107]